MLWGTTAAIHAQDTATPPAAPAPPAAIAAAPAQPIAFNHKLHIQTAKLACNDCHEPRGNGSAVAMPQPAKCMLCHAAIATDKPDIKRLAEAAKNEEPIAWVRVYRVPSFVTFSHKTHTSAGNTCEECHGPVAERTAIALEKNISMGGCIACHQAKAAPVGCDTCHAAMSKNDNDAAPALLAHLHLQTAARPDNTTAQPNPSPHTTPRLAALLTFLNAPLL